MSYDTDVRIDTGSGELSEVAEVGNITSNIGRMFYAAMPGPFEGGGRYDGGNGGGEHRYDEQPAAAYEEAGGLE